MLTQNQTTIDYAALVSRVQRQEPDSIAELYRIFIRGVQLTLRNRVRNMDKDTAEEIAQDVMFSVWDSIRQGKVSHPERLAGFVSIVARRAAIRWIESQVRARHSVKSSDSRHRYRSDREDSYPLVDRLVCDQPNPEQKAQLRERAEIVRKALENLKPVERDILHRFYFREQRPEQIMAELGWSFTQFRLNKCRAKKRLTAEVIKVELGRRQQLQRFIVEKKAA